MRFEGHCLASAALRNAGNFNKEMSVAFNYIDRVDQSVKETSCMQSNSHQDTFSGEIAIAFPLQ